MGSKICKCCNENKSIEEYSAPDRTYCRLCVKIKNKQYKETNKDRLKIQTKKWNEDNREHRLTKKKEYRETHKEEISDYMKEWETKNKTNRRNYARKREREKKKTDPLFRLTHDIRNLLLSSFKRLGLKKNTKGQKILGCTFAELKSYIESLWEPWMNWENKGNCNNGKCADKLNQCWDIDHIIPLCTGNSEEEIKKLNHYTNLRPLCSYVNRYIKRQNDRYGEAK